MINTATDLSFKERGRRIISFIRKADRLTRRRNTWLRYQNTIGTMIFLFSFGGMITAGALFIYGLIPAWLCIVTNAILASLLHELEHDLIHDLYFKGNALLQNLLFTGVWIARGNIISPWLRRGFHLHHHKKSGGADDVEERLISNGMPWGLKRILITVDTAWNMLFQRKVLKTASEVFGRGRVVRSVFPVQFLFGTLWFAFLATSLLMLMQQWFATDLYHEQVTYLWQYLWPVAVIYLLPNFIRQGSLQFISSNMHYYEEVDTVFEQTQVLNRWYLWPFQLFCFNFGSTHSIHHYFVKQPFYLRQMIAGRVHRIYKRYGVPFNDMQTFKRANRKPESLRRRAQAGATMSNRAA